MYLPEREEMAPSAALIATSISSALGWVSFFFLLAVLTWLNHNWRQYRAEAESDRENRDSLAEAVARRIAQIESLQHDIMLRDMIIANQRREDNALHQVPDDVFVIGDDSDSDSESDGGMSQASAFTTSLRPAPVKTGKASAQDQDNASGETKESGEDREVQGVELSTMPPPGSLAYELAVAEARLDSASQCSPRPSAEVLFDLPPTRQAVE